jgi:hypothetical protein
VEVGPAETARRYLQRRVELGLHDRASRQTLRASSRRRHRAPHC